VKSTIGNWIAAGACFAGLVLSAQEDTRKYADLPRYKVKDLGALASGYGISSNGEVAGAVWASDQPGAPFTAFLWRRGEFIKFGTLGGPNSGASVVNAKSEVALSSDTSLSDNEDFCATGTGRQCLAAVWNNYRLTPLLPILGGHNSQAYGINDQGEVAGFSENADYDPSCASGTPSQVFHFQPVVWRTSGEIIRKLQPLPGDQVAFAWGINNLGQAIGGSGSCAKTVLPPRIPFSEHGVLWQKNGRPVLIPGLKGAFTIPTAINNRVDVVGGAEKDGAGHIFLWTEGSGTQDLGTFPGTQFTVAPCCNTINDRRQIVGFVIENDGTQRAFLRQPLPDRRGRTWFYLDELLPADSPWQLAAAQSINDAGQITGAMTRKRNGELHAFLATPCGAERSEHGCQVPER